jgi:hypothetical protein
VRVVREGVVTDPLAPARGVLIRFVISVALWAVIIAVWSVLHG